MDLGSGGGSDQSTPGSGGSGGGALHLTVGGTLTVDGVVTSNGGSVAGAGTYSGGGSGGSVYVTTGTLAGSGVITANGGTAYTWTPGGGGGGAGGRIAIYYDSWDYAGSVTAYGDHGWEYGGAGTVYWEESGQEGQLLLANGGNSGAWTPITEPVSALLVQGQARGNVYGASIAIGATTIANAVTKFNADDQFFGTVNVEASGTLYLAQPATAASVNVASGGVLTAWDGTSFDLAVQGDMTVAGTCYPVTGQVLQLNVGGNLQVLSGGQITADERGFGSDDGPGAGGSGAAAGGGGGYGGGGAQGGCNETPYGVGGTAYGSAFEPTDLGSGGGSDQDAPGNGGRGGGALRIDLPPLMVPDPMLVFPI